MAEQIVPRDVFVADPVRARSPEWDYGVHWTEGGRDWPRWRVSWIVETGELYAVESSNSPAVEVIVLGVIEKDGEYPYSAGTRAWSEFNRRQPIEKLMDGWAEDGPRTLDWIRNRIARAVTA